MAATYTTMQELRDSLGIGTLYTDATVEECCQTAQDLINSFIWFNTAPIVAVGLSSNVATVVIASPGQFVTGQTVTIAAAGTTFNGSRTITGMGPYAVSSNTIFLPPRSNYPLGYQYLRFAITASDVAIHLVEPYGVMTGPDDKTATYANTPAIRSASLILATNIWQSRQSTQNGAMGVDGYNPSPFRMSNTLMASVRGLLAPYLNPSAMIG
ncbi:hypothetical protein UFOVP1648_8 [uncultured Caudovirales phage]|uniref:Uncharacterized protein n=1 Tax=uncultured Caudovirales phage TaxID=2100421 RepID=A0A6J5T2P3_9CAUD|nr:hypothetical protein UFOVP1648_8 [uncultured Caudovirales phage]